MAVTKLPADQIAKIEAKKAEVEQAMLHNNASPKEVARLYDEYCKLLNVLYGRPEGQK